MAWTDITNAQVAAGAPITTALMTALRDNVQAAIQENAGAPAVWGALKSMQAFTASGTWNRPDGIKRVIVIVVGSGQNAAASFSGGAGGLCINLLDVETIATATITIGSVGNLCRWADGTNTLEAEGGSGNGTTSGGLIMTPRQQGGTSNNTDGASSFFGQAGMVGGASTSAGTAAQGYGSGGGRGGGSAGAPNGAGKTGIVWVLEF